MSWPQFRQLGGGDGWCAQNERILVSMSVGNEQYREGILVHVKFRVHLRGVERALLQRRWTGQEPHEEL